MTTAGFAQDAKRRCDVLLAVDAYLPWSGGSRTYYDHLYRHLAADHGLRVIVETTHCAGDEAFDRLHVSPEFQIVRRGVRLNDWKMKRAGTLLRRMFRVASAAARVGPAAVHCGDLFPQDLAGMALRKTMRVPFLVFVHGDEITQTEGRRLQPRVRNAVYRSADAIVAANSFALERVVAIRGGEEGVTMITPGVDCEQFHPGERPEWIAREYGLGSSPVLVTVGRLVKKKGHETVLRSLPTVLERIPGVKYLVVGGGPEEARLKQLAGELGIGASVRFTGDVPHDRLGDFYRAGDVFCMVNQQDAGGDIESFGMVFIEAGASGKAVIGGRSGGTSQSIVEGHTGVFCAPGDSEQLAERLTLLLSSPDLRGRMGRAGLDRARSDFSWGSRAAQLLEVHRTITRPRTGRVDEGKACLG